MEFFDSLFFSVFQYYKPKYKAKSNDIALGYILLLQCSVIVLLGTFLLLFFKQTHVDVISSSKALTLLVIGIVALIFRNWIYYTGKNRRVLNAKWNKSRLQTHNIYSLWAIPVIVITLSIFLMQRI